MPWRRITDIVMTSSSDLCHWSEPKIVLQAEAGEFLFNTAVCRGDGNFVLLYETDDPKWAPAFTFKYMVSDDLLTWRRAPDAIYGRDKYVGGPALYYEDGWHYTLYLEALGGNNWETRIARSRNLVHWEDASPVRPFLPFDPKHSFSYNRDGQLHTVQESNASDAELCYWQGKTIVYFNGGDQQSSGDLQLAEFNGTPAELFKFFFEEADKSCLAMDSQSGVVSSNSQQSNLR